MNLEREGGCLCGAVQFKAVLTGTNFGICHCPMCRKWTGSALLGITVPAGNVTWQGAEHIARRQSSPWGERACHRSLRLVLLPSLAKINVRYRKVTVQVASVCSSLVTLFQEVLSFGRKLEER